MSLTTAKIREQTKIARKLVKNGSLMVHLASLALAVESLEALLVERGVLKSDELMERIENLRSKYYAAGEFVQDAED